MVVGDWAALQVIGQNVVTYLTGSYMITGLIIIALFIVIMLAAGLEFRYALPLALPIAGGFALAGWFGSSPIVTIILLGVAVIYGVFMFKLVN